VTYFNHLRKRFPWCKSRQKHYYKYGQNWKMYCGLLHQ